MKISMQKLADKVGVSKMTISLYLRDPQTKRISEAMKEKIEKAMADYGYEPSLNAQYGDSRKIVAILLPFDMPLFKYELVDDFLNGIQQSLFANGYDFIFLNVPTQNGVPRIDNVTLMKVRSFSGVILFGTRYTQEADMVAVLEKLRRSKIPAVLLNYPSLLDNVIQGISVDDSACAPIEYLISLGHRDIAFMGGTPDSVHTKVLFNEYHEALSKAGLPMDSRLVFDGGFEGYKAYSVLSESLKSGIRFSALFCMSTQMVIGCYRALKENGLRIPEDVSVINYGDPYFTEYLDPPLSTVQLPLSELGHDSADYLVKMISKGVLETDYKIIRHNTLAIRKSTAIFTGE